MSGYDRTTRECSVTQVQPGLYQVIQNYFQKHQLGDPEIETHLCCETISQKRDSGRLATFLDPFLNGDLDTTSHLAMLLTTEWFIWARNGDRSGTVINGASFKMLRVKAYVARRTNEMELEVSGFINNTKESVRGNLRMGPDPAAQKFCEEIGQAVNKANPPVKKTFFGLRGGRP
jgi:hypothetical protein